MNVMKFGGSSVSDAERIKKVSEIIANDFSQKESLFVVVSAFGGVTDSLIEITDLAAENNSKYLSLLKGLIKRINNLANALVPFDDEIRQHLDQNQTTLKNILSGVALIQEASFKTRDYILSFGERNSAYIISKYLNSKNISSRYIDARDFIKTDNTFGAATVIFSDTNKNISELTKYEPCVFLITGFIGSDLESGRTTTLGRGGSDYTAAIFASALNAERLEIWTDVNGVLTSDPRKVTKAYTVPELSYAEALEMSHFGAKVLYAPTIRPVKEKNIPTWIKNTFNPNHPGTIIHNGSSASKNIITGLSSIQDISILSIQGPGLQGVTGIASRFFTCLAKGEINIIMITQASSEHSISIAIKSDRVTLAKKLIEAEFEFELRRNLIEPLSEENDLCLLAIVGENMKNQHGVAGRLFYTLGKNGINIEAISQGSSELNITFAIKADQETKALNTIHDSFFLSEYKSIHLFVVGVGLIGSTLLDLLAENLENIKRFSGLEIILNGISNSKKNLILEEGIDLTQYKKALEEQGVSYDIEAFLDKMISINFAHAVFIDNTANASLPQYYSKILSSNIAISTPNKIAMSSSLAEYKLLKELSFKKNVPFKYETNVAAGLPVISTLENLINSGDQITKIEAVLSGSVSYIFNHFETGGSSFSEIIQKAQALGLTEPDPREDLSGADVKRKLIILARDAGFDITADNIEIESILSMASLNADGVEAFMENLKSENSVYGNMVKKAEQDGCKLRFIAEFSAGRGKVSLKSVNRDSPFYSLSGSDNMIVFHSHRYNNTPLVIRGPGAGADVTAAGILAEIINLANLL